MTHTSPEITEKSISGETKQVADNGPYLSSSAPVHVSNLSSDAPSPEGMMLLYQSGEKMPETMVDAAISDESAFKAIIQKHLQKLGVNDPAEVAKTAKSVQGLIEARLREYHKDMAAKSFDFSDYIEKLEKVSAADEVGITMTLSRAGAGKLMAAPVEGVRISFDGELGTVSIHGTKAKLKEMLSKVYFFADLKELGHFYIDVKVEPEFRRADETIEFVEQDEAPTETVAETVYEYMNLSARIFMFYEPREGFYVTTQQRASSGYAQIEAITGLEIVTPSGENEFLPFRLLAGEQEILFRFDELPALTSGDVDKLYKELQDMLEQETFSQEVRVEVSPESSIPKASEEASQPPSIEEEGGGGAPFIVNLVLTDSSSDLLQDSAQDSSFTGEAADWHEGDTINGGSGDDSLTLTSGLVNVTIDAANYLNIKEVEEIIFQEDAAHNLTVDEDYYTRGDGLNNDVLTLNLSAASTNGVSIDASTVLAPHAVSVTSAAGDDTLAGGGGNDTLIAGSGADDIDSGAGDDRISIHWNGTGAADAPDTFANLALWLDASDLDGDGVEEGAAESGIIAGEVDVWVDKSSNGFDASAAGAANRPTYLASGIGGQASMTFDGVANTLRTAAQTRDIFGAVPAAGTVFFVAEKLSDEVGSQAYMLQFARSGGSSFLTFAVDGSWSGSFTADTDYASVIHWDNSGNFLSSQGDNTATIGTDFVMTSVFNASGIEAFFNGTSLGETATAGPAYAPDTGNGNLGIGASNASLYSNINVAEIIVYDTELSVADFDAVNFYLQDKYSIALGASGSETDDTVDGGAGTDTLVLTGNSFDVNLDGTNYITAIENFDLTGNDVAHDITIQNGYYAADSGVNNDRVSFDFTGNTAAISVNGSGLTGVNALTVNGTGGDDTIQSGAANDVLSGAMGSDSISAGAGDDTITVNWNATSFVLTDVNGLTLWLDGNDVSTMYDATVGGNQVTDGGSVARWENKAGGTNHVIQATGADQAVYNNAASTFNGNSVITSSAGTRYDFVDGTLDTRTVFLVTEEHLDGTANMILGRTNVDLFVRDNLVSFDGGGAESGRAKINGDAFTGVAENVNVSAPETLILTAEYSSNQAFTQLLAREPDAFHYKGDVGEIIVFNSVLTASEIELVEGYLAHKWGLAGLLPASHAYKTVAPGGDDTVDGGAGTDTLNLDSGVFEFSLGATSAIKAIEKFDFSNNDNAHEIILLDGYYTAGDGVTGDVVTFTFSNNSTGVNIDADALTGSHAVSIAGSDGDDTFLGGAGDDRMDGAAGVDSLSGGAGDDIFVFDAINDSGVGAGNRDVIKDMNQSGDDTIDLDGMLGGGANFIGVAAFSLSGVSEVRVEQNGADAVVQFDVGGTGAVDMEILLENTVAATIAASDFSF